LLVNVVGCKHFISSSLDIFAARLAISVERYES
jgi:hypothetical protein